MKDEFELKKELEKAKWAIIGYNTLVIHKIRRLAEQLNGRLPYGEVENRLGPVDIGYLTSVGLKVENGLLIHSDRSFDNILRQLQTLSESNVLHQLFRKHEVDIAEVSFELEYVNWVVNTWFNEEEHALLIDLIKKSEENHNCSFQLETNREKTRRLAEVCPFVRILNNDMVSVDNIQFLKKVGL